MVSLLCMESSLFRFLLFVKSNFRMNHTRRAQKTQCQTVGRIVKVPDLVREGAEDRAVGA